jgi:predicted aspartyl protease
VNGTDARFLLDSGAFFSLISSATAAQFKLKESPAPYGFRIEGIGGSTGATVATVKQFTLAGIPLHNIEFFVGGSEVGSDAVGLLGQNFLEKGDRVRLRQGRGDSVRGERLQAHESRVLERTHAAAVGRRHRLHQSAAPAYHR